MRSGDLGFWGGVSGAAGRHFRSVRELMPYGCVYRKFTATWEGLEGESGRCIFVLPKRIEYEETGTVLCVCSNSDYRNSNL